MNRYDVSQQELITNLATELKSVNDIKAPAWAPFVKTGVSRERPPTQDDWWHIRSASVLRKVSLLGPVGVEKLARKYGGRKNRGYKPEAFRKGSRNLLRKILQQLEAAQLVKQVEKDGHKGRVLTPQGHSMLDKAAKVTHGKN